MCKAKLYKSGKPNPRIDKCMENFIGYLMAVLKVKTKSCCCGHNIYSPSCVVELKNGKNYEIFSGKFIPRKRKFYKRDSEGYYYIPEVVENEK